MSADKQKSDPQAEADAAAKTLRGNVARLATHLAPNGFYIRLAGPFRSRLRRRGHGSKKSSRRAARP